MPRFFGPVSMIAAGLLAAGVPILAAERIYVVSGVQGTGGFQNHWSYSIEIILNGQPTNMGIFPSTSADLKIKVTDISQDSLEWRYLSSTLTFGPGETARRTCRTCTLPAGLEYMLTDAAGLTGMNPVDVQQVTVQGTSHAYARWMTPGPGGRSTFGSYADKTILEGIGPVYYGNGGIGGTSGGWRNNIRLVSYNGIDLDALWGSVLTLPTAIGRTARPSHATRLAARRFDLHEMGIFLGRKSALDRAKPLPAGVK